MGARQERGLPVAANYTQDWPTYNEAQTHEQEKFVVLLRDLCGGIPQPAQTFGRPKLPLSDTVFTVAYKIYSTMSGRRFMSDCREAVVKGLVPNPPSFTSIFRFLENPELTPILKTLIEQSAEIGVNHPPLSFSRKGNLKRDSRHHR